MQHIKFLLPVLVIASSIGSFQGLAKAQSTQDIINDITGEISSIEQEFSDVMQDVNAQKVQRENNLISLCGQGYGWACVEYDQMLEAEGARLDRALQHQIERNQYRTY